MYRLPRISSRIAGGSGGTGGGGGGAGAAIAFTGAGSFFAGMRAAFSAAAGRSVANASTTAGVFVAEWGSFAAGNTAGLAAGGGAVEALDFDFGSGSFFAAEILISATLSLSMSAKP